MIEGGDARAAGFFGLPTTFGNAISMTLCFPGAALLTGWRRKTWENTSILIATVFTARGNCTEASTRAAWIALVLGLLVMACYRGMKPLIITFVSIVVVASAFFAIKPDFRARAATIFDLQYHSNVGRLQMWQTNMWMVQDYPILGIGLNENERRGPEYNEKHGFNDVHLGNAHDTYLQFLAGTGILGLLAYLCFIGYYLWLTVRLLRVIPTGEIWHRTFVLGALGAQVAMHTVGLMDCNFKSMQVQHQFIAILCALSYLRFCLPHASRGQDRLGGRVHAASFSISSILVNATVVVILGLLAQRAGASRPAIQS